MIAPGDPFALVPPPLPSCRATIVIPARDEAARIGRTLEALALQTAIDGSPMPPDRFDVLVYANDCSDGTANVVRAHARGFPQLALHVADEVLPPSGAQLATTRHVAMYAASASFHAAGIDYAVLCATDDNTIQAPAWLA